MSFQPPFTCTGATLLGKGVHRKMDTYRSRFFSECSGTKRKYHWVRCDAVCKPKALGGLGIIDTEIMNQCLMVKWVWKILAGADSLWGKSSGTNIFGKNTFSRTHIGRAPNFGWRFSELNTWCAWGQSTRWSTGVPLDSGGTSGLGLDHFAIDSQPFSTLLGNPRPRWTTLYN